MEDLAMFLLYMVGLNAVLLVGGLIADYVFPHITFIERFLDSITELEEYDYEEVES